MNRRHFLRGLLGTAAPFVRDEPKPDPLAGVFDEPIYEEVMYTDFLVDDETQRLLMLMQLHQRGMISRDSFC